MCWRIFCEFTVYLNINHRIDIRHCMLHLHTHATLYSVCRLVVPCGNEKLVGIQSRWRLLFVLLSQCVERNECFCIWAKRYFLKNSHLELQTDEKWEFEQQCVPTLSIGSDSYSWPTQQTDWSRNIRFRPCKHQDKVVVSWTSSFQDGFLCTGITCVDDHNYSW